MSLPAFFLCRVRHPVKVRLNRGQINSVVNQFVEAEPRSHRTDAAEQAMPHSLLRSEELVP